MRAIVARDLMTPEVLAVDADMTIAEAADFLLENEISGAVVKDGNGKLVGVVSLKDVAAAATEASGEGDFYATGFDEEIGEDELTWIEEASSDKLVADVMSPTIYTVSDDARVPEIATKMLRAHVHRLLVTADDEVVGIISSSDLLGLLVDEN